MEMYNGSFASHEHPLELYKLPEDGRGQNCSACKKDISIGEWIYTCRSCNHNFHMNCLYETSSLINHPLHPQHPLIFFTSTKLQAWEDRILCGACGDRCGSGFSYVCLSCKFGTHIYCVHSKPLSVYHSSHEHQLHLSSCSCSNSGWTICYICRKKIAERRWFYRCGPCNYTVHLDCGIDNLGFGLRKCPPLRLEARVNTSAKMLSGQQSQNTDHMMTKYEDRVKKVSEEISGLETKYHDDANKVGELQSEITDLKTKYEDSAKKVSELQDEITDLKTKYENWRKLVMKVKIEE